MQPDPMWEEMFFIYDEDTYPSSEFSINNMGKLSHEVFSVDEHENLFTGRYNYGKGQWELSNGKIVHSTTRLRWMYKPKAFKL